MADSYDEGSRAHVEHERIARKEHQCAECGRAILKGEPYVDGRGVDADGGPYTYRVCSHCSVALEWIRHNCGGWIGEYVRDDIEEHVQEYHRMDLARLAVGMRRQWKRFDGSRGMPIPPLPRPIKLGDARA